MRHSYQATLGACFAGYIVQSVINLFAPLLFLTFQREFSLSLDQIALLITVNFLVQLCVDGLSARFVDKIGWRVCMVAAHLFAALGLVLLAVLPGRIPPLAGLTTAVVVYALGGGLLEVLVSPIAEACPTRRKSAVMGLLHSFYCWGSVATIALSTLFFVCFGTQNWRILAILWALLPLVNALVFTQVPLASLTPEGESGLSLGQLFRTPRFWLFLLLMACAGASELSISQWASAFAESALGVSKTVGDLAGPLSFALLMGLSRLVYAAYSHNRPSPTGFMTASTILCIAGYLLVSLSPWPALALVGCALCGMAVGCMWPGTFSLAAACFPRSGTALFALLALAGDLGCSAGPGLVGLVSSAWGDRLQYGLLAAAVFPLLLLAGLAALRKTLARQN